MAQIPGKKTSTSQKPTKPKGPKTPQPASLPATYGQPMMAMPTRKTGEMQQPFGYTPYPTSPRNAPLNPFSNPAEAEQSVPGTNDPAQVEIPGEMPPAETEEQATMRELFTVLSTPPPGTKPRRGPLDPLILPRQPSRDLGAEAEERMKTNNLSLWLPALSALLTGNTNAGMDAMPYAYSALDRGQSSVQESQFDANSEMYKGNVSTMLHGQKEKQRVLDAENEQIDLQNEEAVRADESKKKWASDIITKRLMGYKIDDAKQKTTRSEALAFLKTLQATKPEGQMALWMQVQDKWGEWGISPVLDPVTKKYIPITKWTDNIRFLNAQTYADKLKATKEGMALKHQEFFAGLSFKYSHLKDEKEWREEDRKVRLQIASMAKDEAWSRMVYSEDGRMARHDSDLEWKKESFRAMWRFRLESPQGQKVSALYNRASSLRMAIRHATDGMRMVEQNEAKFRSSAVRDKALADYQAVINDARPKLDQMEEQISKLEGARDSGIINESIVDNVLGPDPKAVQAKIDTYKQWGSPGSVPVPGQTVTKPLNGPVKKKAAGTPSGSGRGTRSTSPNRGSGKPPAAKPVGRRVIGKLRDGTPVYEED